MIKRPYLRILVLFSIVFVTVLTYYGLSFYFKPVADISKQKTDIRLSEEQLLKDFETDNKQAELKYKNKVLEITGKIAKVESDSGSSRIIFDQKGNYIIVSSCSGKMDQEVKALKQNQQITVKGIYTGFVIIDDSFLIPGEIKIDQCTILK